MVLKISLDTSERASLHRSIVELPR